MSVGIVFDPLLSWPIWSVLAALSAFAVGFSMWRRLAGAWLRLLAAALVLLVLAGPILQQEAIGRGACAACACGPDFTAGRARCAE